MKTSQFVFWLMPLLVLGLVCSSALTAAQNYYPTEIGNTWTLNTADGTEERRYAITGTENFNGVEVLVLKIDTEALGTGVIVSDQYFISADDTGLTLHQSITDEGTFGIAEVNYEPPTFFFPASPSLGQKWQISGETELLLVGASSNTTSAEVVAIESVVTPAGTFENCAKIELAYKITTALVTLRPVEYIWLAPEVGPIKFQTDQEIVFELESYNLVKPTAAGEVSGGETPHAEQVPAVEEVPTVEEQPSTEEVPPGEVTPPAEEVPADETVVSGAAFDLTLNPGLNMISVPLMPTASYTAKSLSEMLGATAVIKLNAVNQHFLGYTIADNDAGFSIEGGKGYIVNTPTGGMVTFIGTAWDNQPETVAEETPAGKQMGEEGTDPQEVPAAPALSRFKSAWAFIVTSDIQGMETGTGYTLIAENLRTGSIATQNVTDVMRRSTAIWADLNRNSVIEAGDRLTIALYDDRGQLVSGPFQRTITTADLRNAFLSLDMTVGDVRPQETVLAQNFPNPFNPETWIPYQLSASTEVSIKIYDVSGGLVRRLDLGWQAVGSYTSPSRAAYWDGRNAVGERVASGIYFYTLQTSDFAATRRMVILK